MSASDRSRIRIGYVGSARSCAHVARLTGQLPDIDVTSYPASQPFSTSDIYDRASGENDAVVFSGVLLFRHRDRQFDGRVPISTVRFSRYRLVASLLSVIVRDGMSVAELSIDIPDARLLTEIEDDLSTPLTAARVIDYPEVFDDRAEPPLELQRLIEFHQIAREQGAKLALTSVHLVFETLQRDGVPAALMVDPDNSELEAIVLAAQRVAAGRITVDLVAAIAIADCESAGASAAYRISRDALSKVAAPLRHTPAGWDGRYVELAYTTRQTALDFLSQLLDAMGPIHDQAGRVAVGLGIATNAADAEMQAEQAMQRAASSVSSAVFVLDENRTLHGPLDADNADLSDGQRVRFEDATRNQLATNSRVLPRTIDRFVAFAQARGDEPITAAEWAAHARVSARTAERLLRKLAAGGVLRHAGHEQVQAAGRPRELYRLNDNIA